MSGSFKRDRQGTRSVAVARNTNEEKRVIRHIATVAVYVEDQDEALRFWTDQVGFTLTHEQAMGESRWLEVAPSGADSGLVIYPKAFMPHQEALKPSVVFGVDDIDATCERLVANGVKLEKEPEEFPWGKFASFLDTEGNEFGLRG